MQNHFCTKTNIAPPYITTIIPTYRRPLLLKRAITSALEQNIEGLKVSIFDNNSGDNTKDIVQSFITSDHNLSYHEHKTNIGAANNFEFGLKSIQSPYFSILSDDDYLLPEFYRTAISALEKHPEIMFWAGITLNVDEQNSIWDARIDRWPNEGIFSPPNGIKYILNGMSPIWTGIVFRREVLSSVGLPDKQALGPSDLDFILKIAAKHPYMVQKHPSAVFTLNTNSFSNTEPLSSFWPGWKKMLLNIESVIVEYDDSNKKEIMHTLNRDAKRMLFRRGVNAITQERYDFAEDAAKALKEDYSKTFKPSLLILTANFCKKLPVAHGLIKRFYQVLEKRIIDKRKLIKEKYKHLVRPH